MPEVQLFANFMPPVPSVLLSTWQNHQLVQLHCCLAGCYNLCELYGQLYSKIKKNFSAWFSGQGSYHRAASPPGKQQFFSWDWFVQWQFYWRRKMNIYICSPCRSPCGGVKSIKAASELTQLKTNHRSFLSCSFLPAPLTAPITYPLIYLICHCFTLKKLSGKTFKHLQWESTAENIIDKILPFRSAF